MCHREVKLFHPLLSSFTMRIPLFRLVSPFRISNLLRELENDIETVANVLHPGPLGAIEHKYSAKEIHEAKATVRRAVENWRGNCAKDDNQSKTPDNIHLLGVEFSP